jgi:CBS domain-containing protein
MPTIPDDVALQELMVSWSLDVVEPGAQSERAKPDAGRTNQQPSVDKLMRTPATLSERASLGAGAKLFADGIEGPVVIVSDDNKPLGILTAAHVLRMVSESPAEALEQVRLRQMVTTSGPLLAQNTPICDAAERFAASGSDSLVVVKPDGELAGVLMARDVCLLCV